MYTYICMYIVYNRYLYAIVKLILDSWSVYAWVICYILVVKYTQ